jgi:DNA polymerase-3 subunit gamma/tau
MVARPAAGSPPRVRLETLADAVAFAKERRDLRMSLALERQVRPVRFEPGQFEFQPTPDAPPGLAADIARKFSDWTGERWMVAVSTAEGAPTLHERAEADAAARMRGVRAHPHVQAVLERFPGAAIVDVRVPREAEPAVLDGPGGDDLGDPDEA